MNEKEKTSHISAEETRYIERKEERDCLYAIVFGDEAAIFEGLPKFEENSFIITDPRGIKRFGTGSYFVNKQWLDENSLLGE